jgi:Ca-activated chloride channel family protein
MIKYRMLLIVCGFFFIFLFSSCSRGKLFIMEANYLNSRGRFDEAMASYLKALEYEEAAPYAEYGLGSVFYSLDEGKAALERFGNSKKILETLSAESHRELRYRNNYNSGVVFFGEGDFSAAVSAFKEALRIDPGKIEAKRNLELSLMSLARESVLLKERAGEGNEENQRQETRAVLFEYLRQKEQNQWKSREWTPEEHITGPDY